jgi:hypothetical protein
MAFKLSRKCQFVLKKRTGTGVDNIPEIKNKKL